VIGLKPLGFIKGCRVPVIAALTVSKEPNLAQNLPPVGGAKYSKSEPLTLFEERSIKAVRII
jgi:hypothetical protein